MPIPVALNIAIRNTIRRSMVLPMPPPPLPLEEFPEETSPESLAKLRAARAIPSARQDAQDAARDADAARRAQLRPPALGHILRLGNFTVIPPGTLTAAISGQIGFPYTIEEVMFADASAAVAGTVESKRITILISTNESLSLAALQQDQNIILQDPEPLSGVKLTQINLAGQQPTFITFRPNYAVESFPTFIKALFTTAGGSATPGLHVTINEAVPLLIPGIAFRPPIGRTTININTAGAVPRTATRTVPRAAIISTTQGGRILSQRTIAWESLQPELRADWFNRQVGGQADPNIQWIP